MMNQAFKRFVQKRIGKNLIVCGLYLFLNSATVIPSTEQSLTCTTKPARWRTDGQCTICPVWCTTCIPAKRTNDTGWILFATTTRKRSVSLWPAYSLGGRWASLSADSDHPQTNLYPHTVHGLSIIIMIGRLHSLFRFGSQVMPTSLNSINPVGQWVAYGHYFPLEWNE